MIFFKKIFLGIFSNLTWYHFEIVTTLASIIWQKSNGTMPMSLFNKKKTWSEKKIFYSLEYSMWKKLWNVLLEDDKLNWGFTWSSTGAELTLQIATDPLLRGSLPAAEKARRVQLHFHLLILFFSFALASLVYKKQRFSRYDMFGPLLTAQKSLKRASSILFHLFAFCRENYDSTCQSMPIVCGQSG